MDWREYWEAFPRKFDHADFCKQVGRTANGGVPTPEPELERVVSQMAEGLELQASDVVLDLCCGNGLLTRRLAAMCEAVVGVDFSGPMIELAVDHHGAGNLRYVQGSVLELGSLDLGPARFTKVSMFESLQYFDRDQIPELLAGIRACSSDAVIAYFSGVLDRDRIWSFYDTPERRAAYEERVRQGTEIMGTWWRSEELEAVAAAAGFRSQVIPQDPALNTAHYRFDVRLERR